MRRLILAAALALSACTGIQPGGSLPAPADVASKSTTDEAIRQGAESAYAAWRILAEKAVDAGLIKGATATKVAALDNRIFAALALVRKADAAANSTSLASATLQLAALVKDGVALIRGN